MAKVSISEAARLAGVSRQHLYKKYISQGVISVDKGGDTPVIDISELIRVFGRIDGVTVDSQQTVNSLQVATHKDDSDYSHLQAEVKALREALEDKEMQLREAKDREKWLQQHVNEVTGALRLLEHKKDEEIAPKTRRKFLGLF